MNKITKKNVNFVGTNLKTLKLDLTYRPIEVIDSIEALVLCLVGKAIAVEEYENTIRSPSSMFQLPSVIVLKNLVKYRITTIHCTRENVMARDKYTCQYCGDRPLKKELTLDHVLPKSRGGQNTWQNLVSACKKCNQKKGNKTPKEARMFPMNKPCKPKYDFLGNVNFVQDVWLNYLWT
tara:strand:+ start:616 stop:1152 length:537 start_codon:yes stop_codon:yes gene_type:complete